MSDPRTIRQRMTVARNTQKIADAMQRVSTVRYWRILEPLMASRAFCSEIERFVPAGPVGNTSGQGGSNGHLVLAFFPHRGLCGSLTQTLYSAFLAWYPDAKSQKVFLVGKKGENLFRMHGFFRATMMDQDTGTPEPEALATWCLEQIRGQHLWRVDAVFASSRNRLSQIPVKLTIYPPEPGMAEDVLFEPDREKYLEVFLPMYFRGQFRRAFLEASMSEHAARMTAMENSSRNARELIERFRLEYNRVRQNRITMELMEIIGGAEASHE